MRVMKFKEFLIEINIVFKGMEQELGRVGWGGKDYEAGFSSLKSSLIPQKTSHVVKGGSLLIIFFSKVPESYEKQKKLLQNHAAANKAQKKAVKEAKKKKGGSDSGANSR